MLNKKSIKRAIKKTFATPVRMFHKHKAQSTLTQLTTHNNSRLKLIGDALHETLNNTLTTQEQEWITLIEQRRSSLLHSSKEITVIDYGAGNPSCNRTKEEMEKGVKSTACVADVCEASKPIFWATLLFKLIQKLKPLSCVELGTCVGISASYQAVALQINGQGTLLTLEGSSEIAEIAKETFCNLGIQNTSVITGPFHQTLKNTLETAKPIDFFFNDGHHNHDAVIQYFNEALPNLSDEAIVVFDDISWSADMRKAWAKIENHNQVTVSIDLQAIGIVLIGNNSAKKKYRIPITGL